MIRRGFIFSMSAIFSGACGKVERCNDGYYTDLFRKNENILERASSYILRSTSISSIEMRRGEYIFNPPLNSNDAMVGELNNALKNISCYRVGVYRSNQRSSVEYLLSARGIGVSGLAFSFIYTNLMNIGLPSDDVCASTLQAKDFRVFYRELSPGWYFVAKN